MLREGCGIELSGRCIRNPSGFFLHLARLNFFGRERNGRIQLNLIERDNGKRQIVHFGDLLDSVSIERSDGG